MKTEHLEFLPLEEVPPPSPKVEKPPRKKRESPSSEAPPPEESRASTLFFGEPHRTRLTWGIKDRSGEWIVRSITRQFAELLFQRDRDAFQLISGCDPYSCMDESIVEVLTVVKEKSDVAPQEAVLGAGVT
jgi:hypothetical protein